MQRFFSSALVAMLGLALVGSAQARGPHNGSNGSSNGTRPGSNHPQSLRVGSSPINHSPVTFKNYHLSNGTKANFGFFYKGQNHNHWSYRCWYDRCGCYCYYCPCTCCYYYWCGPDSCYYPISYCPYGTYTF